LAITLSSVPCSASHLAAVRPDLVDAGHVVDAVAHQREVVDDLVGAHAELRHHAGFVERVVAHRVEQRHLGAHQLCEILVARGDQHGHARRAGLARERADHVVGLDAGNAQHRDAQRLDQLDHRLDLLPHLVRHRWAVGLVLRIQRVAERGARGVEHERGVARLLLQRGAQHADDAVQRAGGKPVGRGERRQRVERAVQVRRPIDQDQARHRRPPRANEEASLRGRRGPARTVNADARWAHVP
jgi:hypothetical protein